ncbi:MAG TPA: hypothetical protein VNJ08_06085 [Bacteriovoracaceae bacterium]|nr:hypothetical protein [Bacteriovoracaceae bacterium]
MVGLKAVWITISALFLVASCVPQTKQTECRSNEAFNASLRTCVPVIGGPSSFITVDSFSPALPISLYKNDATIIPLTIAIANPFSQTYTVEWERVYFGVPSFFAGNTLTTSVIALSLVSEIGPHFITAKVKAGGIVVDSHTFTVTISDSPRPIIETSTVIPSSYASTFTPVDPAQVFSIKVKNNNSIVAGAGYSVRWSVNKNGVSLPAMTETDTFTNLNSSGSDTYYLGSLVVPTFIPSTLGVGNYIVKAVVSNLSPGETVAEQQWSITIKHPDLSKIASRSLYEAATPNPAYSTAVVAYNGIPFNVPINYPVAPINFVPSLQSTQANFCVAIGSAEGTYSGDGLFVRVDFYLDNSTLIYSGFTALPLDSKVCLTDASAAIQGAVVFSNTTATATQSHQLTARVVDMATNTEYGSANMGPNLGNYPVAWDFTVKPINAPPIVAFTSAANISGLSCGAVAGSSKLCTVVQDAVIRIGVTATDEFYNTSSTDDLQQQMLAYTQTLYKNSTLVSSCAKGAGDVTDNAGPPFPDHVGPDYLCEMTVPSYDANGPIKPTDFTYSIASIVSDVGSPVPGAVASSSAPLFYQLTVSESNTDPRITAQAFVNTGSFISKSTTATTAIPEADFATEGETLNINVAVEDNERDSHQIILKKCGIDDTCSSPTVVETKTVTKTNSTLETTTTFSYYLAENTIPTSTLLNTNQRINFLIETSDLPHTVPSKTATSRIFKVNVQNKNPAPQITGTPNPLTSATLSAYVGFPITINPGTVTDASAVGSTENNISYQWYVDPDGAAGPVSYNAINIPKTDPNLIWTPSNAIPNATPVLIKVCVTDSTTVNPIPASGAAVGLQLSGINANGTNCLGPWTVNVFRNANELLHATATDLDADVAVHQDTTVTTLDKRVVYTAYSDNTNIYIQKNIVNVTTGVSSLVMPGTGYERVSFSAVSSGSVAPNTIKDISMVATSDYLYIAYQCADAGAPTTSRVKVRRIDKRGGVGIFGDISDSVNSYVDNKKFGYAYAGPSITTNNTTAVAIDLVANTVRFAGALAVNDQVSIGAATYVAAAVPTSTQLCAGTGGACSTDLNAQKLAGLINSSQHTVGSTGRTLQAYSAVSGSSTVNIFGALGGEHLDGNPGLSNYHIGKLGKLMIDGAKWFVPFVDMTTAGTLQHIRVIGAPTAQPLNAVTVLDDAVLSGIGPVNYFVNERNTTAPLSPLVIASLSTSNVARIDNYSFAGAPGISATLFGGVPVEAASFRMAAPTTGNNFFFAAAKVLTAVSPLTYEWKIGRYNSALAVSMEERVSVLADSATDTVMDVANVVDISLLNYSEAVEEARLIVSSDNGGTDVNLYALRLRTTSLSCGICVALNPSTQNLSASKKIAATPIDLNMRLGTAGATALEHEKDVTFVAFPATTGGAIHKPYMGVYNMSLESIQSTTADDTGTLGHRPPFIGN